MSENAAPAGSSTYNSDTMYVGDGTWIASENTFLLPNLQGLNFATMQYNSMSNRFAALPQYRRLIIGHGVLAAIVFLLVVPSAIFIARFYYGNPRLALRLHIWLQILTVGLLTVVFILGFNAVGPERSLTNPHHGIGVALYTLVLVQALAGSLVHHFEKGKARRRLPLNLMLHQWLGRAIALLGAAQIPLGMTLYGSPKYAFVLYAVAVFFWALLYFVLSYIHRPGLGFDNGYDSESFISGQTGTEVTEDRRTNRSETHRGRNTALFGAAGLAGLTALGRHRSRSRRRDDELSRTNRTNATPSRVENRHSAAYTDDEKLSATDRARENHTWRNRFLGAGAGLGAYAGLKKLFNRPDKQEKSYVGSYQAPSSVNQSVSRADLSRVQQGQAPMSPGDSRVSRPNGLGAAAATSPTRQTLHSRRRRESFSSDDSYDSLDSYHDPARITGDGPGIKEGIATLGVIGFLRKKQRDRREKKDRRRADAVRLHDQENAEQINRANSRRYTDRRRHSAADTEATNDYAVTGSNPGLSRSNLSHANAPPLPAPAGPLPNQSTSTHRLDSAYLGYDPNSGVPAPPGATSYAPTNVPAYPVAPGAVNMPEPAIQPDPSRLVQHSSTHLPQDAAAAGLAAANIPHRRRSQSRQGRRNSTSQGGMSHSPASAASPPVSVKVQMHRDGRHITLRRLNEEEAAAERDARKLDRRQRRRRAESLSSGVEDGETRFRRNEAMRPANNVPPTNVPQPAQSSRPDELNLPPPPGPPPVPAHSLSPQNAPYQSPQAAASGLTSGVGSPGTWDTGTGTDVSAFNVNRNRRRAERAAAKQQRAVQQGARVEFT